jgi:hypothetical protein
MVENPAAGGPHRRGHRLGHHTVRGFLARLKRKGLKVEALDRMQVIGPGKQGAKEALPNVCPGGEVGQATAFILRGSTMA